MNSIVRYTSVALATRYNFPTNKLQFTSKLIQFVVVGFLFLGLSIHSLQAATVTISANTNWSAITTGSGPGGLPSTADAVIVRGNSTLTVNVTNAVCLSIQIGGTSGGTSGAGTLTFSGTTPNLTVTNLIQVGGWGNTNRNGTVTFTSDATLQGGSVIIGGTGGTPAFGTITMTAGGLLITGSLRSSTAGDAFTEGTGTVQLNATNNLASTDTGAEFNTFNNLIISAGTTTALRIVTISGNLTVNSGAQFDTGATNTGTFTVTGTTNITGTLTLSNTQNKTFTGDVTLNSGGVWNETGVAAIGFGGSLTNNATTFTANTGTHTFSGATKTLSGTTTTSIPTATFTGSYTNSGTFTSATALTVTGGAVVLTNNGTITATTALSGTGGLTQGTTGILNIGGTSGINALTATAAGNTVDYTGAGQTVFNTNYSNLNLSGSAAKTLQTGTTSIGGNLTLSGTATTTGVVGLTIGGNLVIGSGTTFTSGTFIHNVAGNFTNSGGTFTAGSGTIVLNGATQTVNGTNLFNNLTAGGTGLKTFSGTQTVNGILSMEGTGTVSAAPTYGSSATLQYNTTTARTADVEWITPFVASGGVIIGSTGAITLNGAKVQTANLTINSGATLNTSAANNYALTFGGNFTNSGGTITANGSAITITGTGTQSIAGFTTTGSLTCDKSAGVATLTGNVNAGSLTNSTSGGTLNLGTTLTHTISGTWTRTNGTLDGSSSTLNIGGNVTNTAGSFTSGTSTVNYNGGAQTIADVNYYHLNLSGSGAKTMGANTTTIGGNLTLSGTATATTAAALSITGNLTVGTGTTLATGATNTWTLSVGGTTSVTGNLTLANTGNKTFTGDVTLNAGAVWNETGIAAIGYGGNVTNNATTFTANTGTHTFSGATKIVSGSTTYTIPTATFTGSYTNNGTITSATALTVTGGAVVLTNNGTITATLALSGTGGLTQGTTGILNIGGTSGITALTATASGNTVNYNGGAQTVFSTNYHHLTYSGSGAKTMGAGTTSVGGDLTLSGTATATTAAALSITGNLSVGTGTTFATGATNTWTLGVGGTTSLTGTLTLANTGTKTFTGDVTLNSGGIWNETGIASIGFGGNVTNNATTFTANTGTHTFSGATKIVSGSTTYTIPTATFTGSYTNNATITSATALTVTGAAVVLTNNGTITATTALSGTGGLTQGTTGILNIGGTSGITALTATASGNTVNYNGGAQSVFNTNYHHLTLSGSGAKTLLTGTTTIGGNLTFSGTASATGVVGLTVTGDVIIGSGTTFTSGTFTHNVAGNWTNNGGTFTSGSGTVNFTGSNKAINGTAATQTFNNITINKTAGQLLSVGGSTTTLTVNGNFTETTGNFTAPATMSVGGNLTLSAGTFTAGTTFTFTGGTWTNTAGVFTHNNGTVIFSLGGAQAISGTLGTTFNNFTISTSGLKTLTTVPTINGIFTITGTPTVSVAPTYGSAATLYYNTTTGRNAGVEWITPFVASGGVIIGSTGTITLNAPKVFNSTAPLTVNSGATLANSTNLLTLNGDFINNGGTTSGTGGVTITGTATQSIGSFINTGTVSMTKSSGTATFMGNVNGGALTINGAAGVLNLGTSLTHTFTGAVTLTAGTLNGGTTSTLNENLTGTAWTGTGGTFTANTGTVNFGGVAQTINYASTFNNLTFSGGGTKTIGVNTAVNGTLTLTSGLVTLGSNNLTLGTASPAISGSFSATNMVVATGAGELRKLYTANESYVFPVGDATVTTEYSPMTVSFASGTYAGGAYVGVRVTNSKQSNNTSPSNYINRYWTVSSSGITAFSASVTGTYLPADIVGTETSAVAARYSGSLPWYTYTALGSNTLSATGLSTFGDFTGINNTPLIVTSVSTLSGFVYPYGTGPSSEKSFTVTGSALTSNVSLSITSNYEMSTGTGGSFVASSPLVLPISGGSLSTTTVYVRLKAGLSVGTYAADSIMATSSGASTQKVKFSGSVASAPAITTTLVGSWPTPNFTYMFTKGPSTEQSFKVGGTNLSGSVTVTPPSDFEISRKTGASFVALTSITYNATGAIPWTLADSTLYIRMKSGLGIGSHNQNVVASSLGATSQNVSCTGIVSKAPTIFNNTSLLSGFIYTFGYGPSGIQTFVVKGANLTTDVTATPSGNYEISKNGSAFQSTPLTLTRNATDSTIQNSDTLVYVRLKTALAVNANYGPLGSNITLTATNALTKSVSCSGSVVATTSETITSSKTSLSGFGYLYSASPPGGPSEPQSFVISGASLTSASITVALDSTTYEISTSPNSGFQTSAFTITGSSIATTPVKYVVPPTPIYVRLKSGQTARSYTTNITLKLAGVLFKTISLVGKVFASPLISASGGGTFCQGDSVRLTSTGADIQTRYWMGPNSYYSSIASPKLTSSATPAMSGTYTVTGNVVVGGNLITNGDFEAGNYSFGSGYTVVADTTVTNALWTEGLYAIIKIPKSCHPNFSTWPDHTSGHGYQMVVNGNPTAGVVVWSQSVPVVPGAKYVFTYWEQSVHATNPSRLQLYVNGVAAGPVYDASSTINNWTQFLYNAEAGTNKVLNLELINQNTVLDGNDFALDDIVFQQILSATATTDVTVNPSMPVSVTVAASANPVYTGTPVTYTATPTNGGTAPSYQWKKNGVNVGTNSPYYTVTPNDKDSISCVLTSNIACPINNPANAYVKMVVNPRVNFWIGTIDTDWAKTGNWTQDFVPLPGDDVEYATTSNWTTNAINDLYLDKNRTIGSLINATTKRLVIPAGKGLEVNNVISTDGDVDRIWIKTSATKANGSIHFNYPTYNTAVNATVYMYSRATWDKTAAVNSKYKWQYFGIPVTSVKADPTFYGSYVRKWYESGDSITNHWRMLGNDSILKPFYGYEICQKDTTTITFTGTLVTSNFSSGQLPVTSTALYPGQHIFANPYTAGIAIKYLTYSNDVEATAYIYNTGTYNQWFADGGVHSGFSTGQYVAAPKNVAGQFTIPGQIASMQAVLIKAKTPFTNVSFGINYTATVVDFDTTLHRVKGVNDELNTDKICTIVDVKGANISNVSDRLWLITEPSCSRKFDNGWDGYKFIGPAISPQLFTLEQDGKYQIDAMDDMNDMELGFIPGSDQNYTMTFSHANVRNKYAGIYLVDKLENKTVEVTESGSEYTFSAGTTDNTENRFKIVARHYEKDAPDKDTKVKIFSGTGNIFVQNYSDQSGSIHIYDIAGHYIKNVPLTPYGITTITGIIPGAYVAKAVSATEDVSKRLIVR